MASRCFPHPLFWEISPFSFSKDLFLLASILHCSDYFLFVVPRDIWFYWLPQHSSFCDYFLPVDVTWLKEKAGQHFSPQVNHALFPNQIAFWFSLKIKRLCQGDKTAKRKVTSVAKSCLHFRTPTITESGWRLPVELLWDVLSLMQLQNFSICIIY